MVRSVNEGKRFFGGLQWHQWLSYKRLAIGSYQMEGSRLDLVTVFGPHVEVPPTGKFLGTMTIGSKPDRVYTWRSPHNPATVFPTNVFHRMVFQRSFPRVRYCGI